MNKQTQDFSIEGSRELKSLFTRINDTLAGFEKMVEEAEDTFEPIAREFRDMHAQQSQKLETLMNEYGLSCDKKQSFMATVNETVVSVRSFLTDLNEDVLAQVRSGEQHVLNAFDAAINKVNDETLHHHLTEMREELRSLVNKTRHLG